MIEEVKKAQLSGDYLSAYDLATKTLKTEPKNLSMKYQAIMALVNSGAIDLATKLYRKWDLMSVGELDFQSLAGRLAKEKALSTSGESRKAFMMQAHGVYRSLFEKFADYYPGINAATTAYLANETAEAAKIAARVIEIIAKKTPYDELEAFHLTATRAEANLLLGDSSGARAAVRQAATYMQGNYLIRARAVSQLTLICDSSGQDDNILEAIRPPGCVNYCGYLAADDGAPGRLRASQHLFVETQIRKILQDKNFGFAFGQLACGADIIFAEAFLENGGELNVVLPYPPEVFKKLSVAIGGQGWVARFENCLSRAKSVVSLCEDDCDDFHQVNEFVARVTMGRTILRAKNLSTVAEQVVVWNGPHSGHAGITEQMYLAWQSAGRNSCQIILPDKGVGSRRQVFKEPVGVSGPAKREVKALLFGDLKGFTRLPEVLLPKFWDGPMSAIGSIINQMDCDIAYKNTWGDAIYLVFDDVKAAARCAIEVQSVFATDSLEKHGLPGDLELRLSGHCGPVFKGFNSVLNCEHFFGGQVTRTARMEPITPPGQVYVSEAFAAMLALSDSQEFQCDYVGIVPTAKDFGSFRMFRLRESSI